jgi:ABC-type nitrate/sulfonate/bicarbonate transport system substrate-binding protein
MIPQKEGRAMPTLGGRPWSRREFLGGATLGGAAGLIGLWPPAAAAEPPPETTRIRFRGWTGSICTAPQYVAEDLLRAEGFTDVQYLTRAAAGTIRETLGAGRIDLNVNVFLEHVAQLDAGAPVVALSQLLCCFAFGNRDFVRRHPVATKRALRALLKATDLCAQDPAGTARVLVDGKQTPPESYDYAAQAIREVAYNRWRTYDPEGIMRFYALRLRDAGMIQSSPQKLIAQGTDWRFLTELKQELKG